MLSSRRDFGPVTRHFFAPSFYILYTADLNYLIRLVRYLYILLDISVVNSHATSAYECELLAVTWHYSSLPVMNGHPRDQAKMSVHDRWPLVGGTGGRRQT